jgi:outer membrane protein
MNKILITALILMAFISELKAQDTLKINFREAVEIGLQQNLSFKQLGNLQEVLKKEKQAAQMAHLPNLNISNNGFRQSGQQFQQVEDQLIVTNVSNNIITSGLNSAIPIFNGGRRINNTKATMLFEEAGENSLQRAAQEVMFNIGRQYQQVL